MKDRWGRTPVSRACQVLMLIVTVTIGQEQPTSLPTASEAFPYRWNVLMGIPLSPPGYNRFHHYSIARRWSRPWIFKNSGLGQSMRVGILAAIYLPAESSGLSNQYRQYFYTSGYVMLDFDYALMASPSANPSTPTRLSLVAGLGAGPSTYTRIRPYDWPTFLVYQKKNGVGYLANAGLRLEIGRLMGEVRLNVNNGQPNSIITLNGGYQTKTAVGAVALPLIGVVVGLILLNIIFSGGGIGFGF